MKKLILASTFALLSLTSCSKKEEPTTYTPVAPVTPSLTAPSVNTYVPPVTPTVEEEPDAVTSPTVLDEETQFGDSTYEVFFQYSDRSEFFLDTYPTVDAMIFYALSREYVSDASQPMDVVHQAVKESLGPRYSEVRGNFSLLTRDAYRFSEDRASLKEQYSMNLSDLPASWFTGIEEDERYLVDKYLLDHYNINDLFFYQHYSGLPGVFSFFSFYTAYEDVIWSLDQMDEEQAEPLRELLVRVLDHSDKISGAEQETYFSETISAKDLISTRDTFLGYFPNEIKHTSFDLTPGRIGYYHSGTIYGMTPIEHLVPERLYSNSLVTYSNITETLMTGYAESKTVQIYLPRQDTDANMVLTFQEIRYNDDAMYGYMKVQTTRMIDFNVMDAMKLHEENETKIEFIHDFSNGVALESPIVPEVSEEPDTLEDLDVLEDPETLEHPDGLEDPDALEHPDGLEDPDALEHPDSLEHSDTSEDPDILADPDALEQPDAPTDAENSEILPESEEIVVDEVVDTSVPEEVQGEVSGFEPTPTVTEVPSEAPVEGEHQETSPPASQPELAETN